MSASFSGNSRFTGFLGVPGPKRVMSQVQTGVEPYVRQGGRGWVRQPGTVGSWVGGTPKRLLAEKKSVGGPNCVGWGGNPPVGGRFVGWEPVLLVGAPTDQKKTGPDFF